MSAQLKLGANLNKNKEGFLRSVIEEILKITL